MDDRRGRAILFVVSASTVVAWSALFGAAVGLLALLTRPDENRYVSAAVAIVGLFGAVLASAVGTLAGGVGLGLAHWKDIPRGQLTLAFLLNLLVLLGGLVYITSLE